MNTRCGPAPLASSSKRRAASTSPSSAAASALYASQRGLRQIQELLGHKHLDSTQRYTRVNAHELRGAIKRLRWVG
ncbi:MAG TPA: tyrosine-type recombinase/integrase [Gaiellaceae bacterium]